MPNRHGTHHSLLGKWAAAAFGDSCPNIYTIVNLASEN